MEKSSIQIVEQKQPEIFHRFKKIIQQQKMSHAYLFEGASGTGKKELAFWLALRVYCQKPEGEDPCYSCNNCRRILLQEHPDVKWVEPDGQRIKVEQIRDLKAEFIKSGVEARRKVIILQHGDRMTTSAANSLLKFLEEPDGQVTIILLTESKAGILPTIQSRCQIYHFHGIKRELYVRELGESGISENQANFLSQLTDSAVEALRLSQDQTFLEAKKTVKVWYDYLKKKDLQAFTFVQKRIVPQIKEKSQQLLVLDMLALFFREDLMNSQKIGDPFFVEGIEKVLISRTKLVANVSFQNVCEQLSWQLTH